MGGPGREANPKLESAVRQAVLLATILLILATACLAGTVTVTSPAPGSTTSSPVHFVASATSSNPVSSMMIYVDNAPVFTVYKSSLDTYVSMGNGSHSIAMKSWDSTGAVTVKTLGISVNGTAATAGGGTYWAVDQMNGWTVCSNCAGTSGQQDAASWFKQGVSSPSMDGNAMQFFIGGTTPYRNALWYKGFGPNSAHHFTYDVYFYLTNPNFSEALEFDLNQYIGGRKYIFGHQCSPKWSKTWDTWNQTTGHWESTGIACPVFPAYQWNHVVIEVERTTDNQLHYVAITFNGVKNYVNRYRPSNGSSWNGFSVDFQMDGDSAQNDYATWLDNMNINYW